MSGTIDSVFFSSLESEKKLSADKKAVTKYRGYTFARLDSGDFAYMLQLKRKMLAQFFQCVQEPTYGLKVVSGKDRIVRKFSGDTYIYDGDLINGICHGVGKFYIINKLFISGVFIHGVFVGGTCKVINNEGKYYEGGVVFDGPGKYKAHVNGVLKNKAGDHIYYEGGWYLGKRHGGGRAEVVENRFIKVHYIKGKFQSGEGSFKTNGKTYSGKMTEKRPGVYTLHGYGTKKNKFDQLQYEGFWVNGKRHGSGKIYFDGSTDEYVEGTFVKDKLKEGSGCYKLENGYKYEGQLQETKDGGFLPHGKGCYTNDKGLTVYSGDYVDGKYDGEGRLNFDEKHYIDGIFSKGKMKSGKGFFKMMSNAFGNEYRGSIIEHDDGFAPHGFGEMLDKDGKTVCSGEFVKGKMHGKGFNIGKNGESYGSWNDGCLHGENNSYFIPSADDRGVAVKDDRCGTLFTGRWVEGDRDGDFTMINSHGSALVLRFEKDRFVSGSGTIFYKNGCYKGAVSGNYNIFDPSGYGVLTHIDGEVSSGNWKYDRFRGEGSHLHGLGSIRFLNGSSHGIYRNGRFIKGTIITEAGTRMEGWWKRNSHSNLRGAEQRAWREKNPRNKFGVFLHGLGCITFTNGGYRAGKFSRGFFKEGWIKMMIPEGSYEGEFINIGNVLVLDDQDPPYYKETLVPKGRGILRNKQGDVIEEGYWA